MGWTQIWYWAPEQDQDDQPVDRWLGPAGSRKRRMPRALAGLPLAHIRIVRGWRPPGSTVRWNRPESPLVVEVLQHPGGRRHAAAALASPQPRTTREDRARGMVVSKHGFQRRSSPGAASTSRDGARPQAARDPGLERRAGAAGLGRSSGEGCQPNRRDDPFRRDLQPAKRQPLHRCARDDGGHLQGHLPHHDQSRRDRAPRPPSPATSRSPPMTPPSRPTPAGSPPGTAKTAPGRRSPSARPSTTGSPARTAPRSATTAWSTRRATPTARSPSTSTGSCSSAETQPSTNGDPGWPAGTDKLPRQRSAHVPGRRMRMTRKRERCCWWRPSGRWCSSYLEPRRSRRDRHSPGPGCVAIVGRCRGGAGRARARGVGPGLAPEPVQ